MSSAKNQIFPALCLVFVLCLTAWIYWPGLDGPFLVDDFHNLKQLNDQGGVTNLESAVAFVFGNSSGMLGRPVSMASFLLSDQYWPGHAFSFKYHNLLFHLLCGVLLFYLALRVLLLLKIPLTSAALMSIFVASFWLLHPYNVSTTLYVVQRMTQLAAIFSIAAMIFFIIGRQRIASSSENGLRFIVFAVFVLVPLSVLSKENGILTLLFFVLIEKMFFSPINTNKFYRQFYWSCVVFPLTVLAGYLISRIPGFMRNYEFRSFSLTERLLTETRILLDYVYYILVPQNFGTGLVHDDFVVSNNLFQPISTLWATLAIIVLLLLAYALRNKIVVVSFGVIFFFSGHLLESSFIPLELYFEHRNYLPMFGLLLILSYGIYLLTLIESRRLGQFMAVFVVCFYLFIASMLTHQSAKYWNNKFDLLTIWATEHPESLRAQRVYGQMLGDHKEWYYEGLRLLERSSAKFPDDITLPMLMVINACKNGKALPVELNELIRMSDRAYYHGGLILVAKIFSDLYISGACSEGNSELGHKLIHKLEELPGMIGLKKSELLYHHSEKYAQQGQYEVAVLMLDEAFKHQQIWLIPYTQAVYSTSAGMLDDALRYIDTALKVDNQRKRHELSQKTKMVELKKSIQILMEKHNPDISS